MKTLLKLALFLGVWAGIAAAQPSNPQITYTSNAPSGSCGATRIALLTPDGTLYTCQNGTWAAVGGGAVGNCAALGGDLSGTCSNAVVVGTNGLGLPVAAPIVGTTILGRIVAKDAATITAFLNPCTATLQGAVPTPPNATNVFLRGDCTFTGIGAAALPNAGVMTGDVITTFPAVTVAKVNGVSSPASPANHTVQVVTASNTRTDKVVPDCTDTGGNHLNFTQSTDAFSCGTSGGATSNQNIRSIGASFDGGGSALVVGSTAYITVPYACTIAGYNIVIDTGTISFDVWKIATGTAKPTVANTILSSYLSVSSGTALHSTSTSSFTTTTSTAFDIYGINVQAASSVTKANLVVQCNATT